jgi:hypothetical protein
MKTMYIMHGILRRIPMILNHIKKNGILIRKNRDVIIVVGCR